MRVRETNRGSCGDRKRVVASPIRFVVDRDKRFDFIFSGSMRSPWERKRDSKRLRKKARFMVVLVHHGLKKSLNNGRFKPFC